MGYSIAAATNRALEAAAGEFVAFLDHDDELHPDALLACVELLNHKPDTDAIYTDEDLYTVSSADRRVDAFFAGSNGGTVLVGIMVSDRADPIFC